MEFNCKANKQNVDNIVQYFKTLNPDLNICSKELVREEDGLKKYQILLEGTKIIESEKYGDKKLRVSSDKKYVESVFDKGEYAVCLSLYRDRISRLRQKPSSCFPFTDVRELSPENSYNFCFVKLVKSMGIVLQQKDISEVKNNIVKPHFKKGSSKKNKNWPNPRSLREEPESDVRYDKIVNKVARHYFVLLREAYQEQKKLSPNLRKIHRVKDLTYLIPSSHVSIPYESKEYDSLSNNNDHQDRARRAKYVSQCYIEWYEKGCPKNFVMTSGKSLKNLKPHIEHPWSKHKTLSKIIDGVFKGLELSVPEDKIVEYICTVLKTRQSTVLMMYGSQDNKISRRKEDLIEFLGTKMPRIKTDKESDGLDRYTNAYIFERSALCKGSKSHLSKQEIKSIDSQIENEIAQALTKMLSSNKVIRITAK